MRPTPVHKSEAFTRIELIVVIVVGFVLLSMLIPTRQRACCKASRISCMNNLKQIGTAYRIWENDHGDRYPALQSVAKGGWNELLTNADQGFLCWTNYAIMANEFGQSPKLLVCPSDWRMHAGTFTNFANTNLSYFVGVSADDYQPQSLLAGDRNLGPGNQPGRDYGFSPENGQGNDVAIPIKTRDGPVCWSLKIHSAGNSVGAGNIMLGDGSGQQVSTPSFRKIWLSKADPTTNWPAGHIPSSPSIRVLFP
jgi:competence protein ComGC